MYKLIKNSHKKLEKRLRSSLGKAINDYQMIKDNDLVMVCLSGGKDSYTMLELLISLKRNSQANFDLIAVNLDQNHPGFPSQTIPKYVSNKKIPYKIIKQDTYSVVNRIIYSVSCSKGQSRRYTFSSCYTKTISRCNNWFD